MKVHFETTGCRLNQIESESAARIFLDKSFSVSLSSFTAKSAVDPDIVLCVLNTCAVTQKAEQKNRRIIRLLLEKCPRAAVLVTGCYAQLSPENIESIDKRIAALPGLLKSRIEDVAAELSAFIAEKSEFCAADFTALLKAGICARAPEKSGFSENAFKLSTDSFLAHSRSSIKIQDGCNNACSYCTIHIARGHSVSLDARTVIDRVKQLESAGQSEVVFTGVNIGQYRGAYNGGYIDFAYLLKLCLEETSSICFRISSLYPEVADDFFCDVIKDCRVRPHFHISVQSGSDSVLKRMARAYTADDVRVACRKLSEAKKNPFLACDIITGFPGETASDFEDTLSLCRDCGFAWVHIFPFSERPGTPACAMKPKIPQSVSGERARVLGEWAALSKIRYIESCIGNTYSAVLETVKRPAVYADGMEMYHAVTENFLHCKIIRKSSDKKIQPGSAVSVRIISAVPSKKGGEIDCTAEIV